jgi:hypothetical protein
MAGVVATGGDSPAGSGGVEVETTMNGMGTAAKIESEARRRRCYGLDRAAKMERKREGRRPRFIKGTFSPGWWSEPGLKVTFSRKCSHGPGVKVVLVGCENTGYL